MNLSLIVTAHPCHGYDKTCGGQVWKDVEEPGRMWKNLEGLGMASALLARYLRRRCGRTVV